MNLANNQEIIYYEVTKGDLWFFGVMVGASCAVVWLLLSEAANIIANKYYDWQERHKDDPIEDASEISIATEPYTPAVDPSIQLAKEIANEEEREVHPNKGDERGNNSSERSSSEDSSQKGLDT